MNISLSKKEIMVLKEALDSYEDALFHDKSRHLKEIQVQIESLDTKLDEAANRLTNEEGQN